MPHDRRDPETKHRDRIILSGMIFRGHHGVTEAERELVQRFEVDLTLELDLGPAAEQDDLSTACDYVKVFECVRDIVEERTFHLLETLASNVADALLVLFPEIAAVRVGVYKPDPPLHGTFEKVGVEIWRERSSAHTSD